MNNLLIAGFNSTNKKTIRILLVGIVVFVSLVVLQDFIRAHVNGSAFYVSESILFSSFWWLFAPLLLVQYTLYKHVRARHSGFQWLAMAGPVAIHLGMFPLLVWLLSSIFYYHTFAIPQTLRYALSEHLYLLVAVYATPVFWYSFYGKKAKADVSPVTPDATDNPTFIQAILVTDGGKKRTVPLGEIVYLSALPPYIGVHTDQKKYLYTETLKSIATQLPAQQFVRIHKSTIVNINQVASYRSRLNGDYDLILHNQITLRVSRNFAAQFKQRFQQRHPLATE